MSKKILATLGVLVGGLASVLALLNAFGVDLTEDQQKAILGVAGVMLLVVSAWLHPDLPPPPPDA